MMSSKRARDDGGFESPAKRRRVSLPVEGVEPTPMEILDKLATGPRSGAVTAVELRILADADRIVFGKRKKGKGAYPYCRMTMSFLPGMTYGRFTMEDAEAPFGVSFFPSTPGSMDGKYRLAVGLPRGSVNHRAMKAFENATLRAFAANMAAYRAGTLTPAKDCWMYGIKYNNKALGSKSASGGWAFDTSNPDWMDSVVCKFVQVKTDEVDMSEVMEYDPKVNFSIDMRDPCPRGTPKELWYCPTQFFIEESAGSFAMTTNAEARANLVSTPFHIVRAVIGTVKGVVRSSKGLSIQCKAFCLYIRLTTPASGGYSLAPGPVSSVPFVWGTPPPTTADIARADEEIEAPPPPSARAWGGSDE